MRIAFLTFVGIVLILSLYPLAFDWTRDPDWNLPLGLIYSRSDWVDLVANFFFYLPLGWTGALAFTRRPNARTVLWAALLGATLSYSIEVAQLYMPRRFSSWRDVVLNTLGTAAGAWVAAWPAWRQLPTSGRLGTAPVAWWLLACWTTWLTFPFYPALKMVQLRRAVEHTMEEIADPSFPVVLAGLHFFGGAVLALAARVPGQIRWLIPALALAAVVWMTLVQGLRFSPGRVLATLAGFGLVALCDLPRRRWLAAALASGWLAYYAFYGCDFRTLPRDFGWGPFDGLTRETLVRNVRDYAGKALITSAAVWSLRHTGLRAVAPVAVVALVVAGEWAQRYAPGRSPGITDILLAGVAAGLVMLLEPGRYSLAKSSAPAPVSRRRR